MPRWLAMLAGVAALCGCGPAPQPDGPPDPAATGAPPALTPSPGPSDPAPAPEPALSEPPIAAAPPLLGVELVRQEWSRADNRETCAPLALASDGGAGGKPRRADFSGGWAVAFDLPRRRSAYGIAGAGVEPVGGDSPAARRAALAEQWPALRSLDGPGAGLPPGSVAGYGLEGAKPFPRNDLQARGVNLLAYVTIPSQGCLYNVWSKLGRTHLELLLDSLRVIPSD